MHEVSLLAELVALVEAERTLQAFSRVRLIRIRLGTLGPAEPDALRFCFDAVVSGTVADGARLEIETEAAAAWCSHCRSTVPVEERFAACPLCDHFPLRLTAGDALRLVELEVE